MKKIIFLLPIILFAFVNVSVNKKSVYPGEEVVFTIEASGNNIEFPTINNIGSFPVQGSAVSQNITILNGNMQKSISKSYIFFPTKSVTIPSFNVKIDSKIYKTKPIKITVTKAKMTKDANFKLKLSVNKTHAYISEPIIFKIIFFQKEGTTPQSIEIQKPKFSDFFTRQISKKEYKKDNFNITEYSFLLIPQKEGNYKIGPILAKIGYLVKETPFNDPFFNLMSASLKYKTIFSNDLNITVKSIPKSAVFGDFKVSIKANKTTIKPNEAVKVNLVIKGCGDFYDLPDFKLNLSDATVYENSPKINTYIKDNKLCGEYNKEFSIISNNNIKIHKK
jgi:sporulation-control protein spo0M